MAIEITFTREDLLPEHREDPASTIRYEKLGNKIKKVVDVAGMAKFVDVGTYNRVYAPWFCSAADGDTLEPKKTLDVGGLIDSGKVAYVLQGLGVDPSPERVQQIIDAVVADAAERLQSQLDAYRSRGKARSLVPGARHRPVCHGHSEG